MILLTLIFDPAHQAMIVEKLNSVEFKYLCQILQLSLLGNEYRYL